MSSLQQYSFNFNKSLSYNFQGGNLSSDSGLLTIRSFVEKLGVKPLLEDIFKNHSYKKHSFASIAEQLIYTTIAGYRHDASLNDLLLTLFEKGNTFETTENMVLDIDSTNFRTFGKQEGSNYNYHYAAKGYHPLMLFNGLNGDLMKVELREGNVYTSNNSISFLEPIFKWLKQKYFGTTILLRGDSGFASSEIYDLCHDYNIDILIKLKSNAVLKKLSSPALSCFIREFESDYSKSYFYCYNP